MLEAADIKQAVTQWVDVRGKHMMPTASQFGAFQMRPFLPNVAVFRRLGDDNYQISLQGTALVELFGFDATGKDVSVVYPDAEVPGLMALFNLLFSSSYLSHSLRVYTNRTGEQFTGEQVLLPISNEDGEHDRYVFVACNIQRPKRPRSVPGKPLEIGDLKARTIYDPRTLMPVACFATTQRNTAMMQRAITAACG